MKRTKKTTIVVLGIVLSLSTVCVWALRRTPLGHVIWPPRTPPIVSDVPVFATPFPSFPLRARLYVRTVAKDKDTVLITREGRFYEATEVPTAYPVLRYNALSRTLAQVAPTKWRDAGGEVTNLRGKQEGLKGLRWRTVDGVGHCSIDGAPFKPVPKKGRFAVRAHYLPSRGCMARLTADGPKRPESDPIVPFGPSIGGGYHGQHYIEFFSIPEIRPIGEAVRIPFTTVEGIGRPCWSADGRFLVYPNSDGTKMCVIHVPQEGQTP